MGEVTIIDRVPFWKGKPKSRVFVDADGAIDMDMEFVRKYPAPPIYIECELCGVPHIQVEWARFGTPFVCGGCAFGRRHHGPAYGDTSWEDHRIICEAAAILKALEAEVENVRRTAV